MTVAPDITQEETDAALVEAQKVTSAPVSVVVAGQIALLDAATLAANASYVPTDGNLVLQMNGDGLTDVVLAQLPDLLTASADAHFEFVNDAPVIVPGTPGHVARPRGAGDRGRRGGHLGRPDGPRSSSSRRTRRSRPRSSRRWASRRSSRSSPRR